MNSWKLLEKARWNFFLIGFAFTVLSIQLEIQIVKMILICELVESFKVKIYQVRIRYMAAEWTLYKLLKFVHLTWFKCCHSEVKNVLTFVD